MQPSFGMREKAGYLSDHPKPLMQRGAIRKLSFKKNKTMKELINVFVKDYQTDGFTRREWIKGGVYTTAIVIICIVAEMINAL